MIVNDFIKMILEVCVAVSSVAITYYLVPLLNDIHDNKMDSKFRKFLDEAVRSAEQVLKGSGRGAEKKDLVLKTATAWLVKHGIEMTETELDNMIESLVFNIHLEETVK